MQLSYPLKGSILNEKSSRPTTIAIILGVLVLLVAFRWQNIRDLFSGNEFPEPAFHWEHNWADAERIAKEQNKSMLVVFSASWCPPCKMMKREVWPDKRVGEVVTAGFVPIYVDVDLPEHSEKVSKYQVTGIPMVVVLNDDGSVKRQTHTMSVEEAVQFLSAK